MLRTTITLRESPDADEPFDLSMAAQRTADAWPHHIVSANLPFGTVLQEVSRFLDLNLR